MSRSGSTLRARSRHDGYSSATIAIPARSPSSSMIGTCAAIDGVPKSSTSRSTGAAAGRCCRQVDAALAAGEVAADEHDAVGVGEVDAAGLHVGPRPAACTTSVTRASPPPAPAGKGRGPRGCWPSTPASARIRAPRVSRKSASLCCTDTTLATATTTSSTVSWSTRNCPARVAGHNRERDHKFHNLHCFPKRDEHHTQSPPSSRSGSSESATHEQIGDQMMRPHARVEGRRRGRVARRRPAAGHGMRGHPRRAEPRPDDADPQQRRRRLRPDRPGRGRGHGQGRHHRRLLRGDQRDRRRRLRRDDPADERRGRRAHADDRRARRRRVAVLLRRPLQAAGRDAARPADRGPGGRAGPGRLALRDHRGPRDGLAGRPGRRSSSAAAPRPAGPTTCSRCSSPPRSTSTPARSATCRTTAAAR